VLYSAGIYEICITEPKQEDNGIYFETNNDKYFIKIFEASNRRIHFSLFKENGGQLFNAIRMY